MDVVKNQTSAREDSGALDFLRGGISLSLAIFLGAFLLFQVQPLIGKFILPWFGGAPAVWTTCLLFFQTVLLAGYAYAHFATRWFSPRAQALVHCVLLAGALLALPIVPADHWKPGPGQNPSARIVLLLAASVGLPYFALATTGPLLQTWFARLNPSRSPYRLFALSNFGSLLALLSYPLVIEPYLSRQSQAKIWGIGLGIFAIVCSWCAVRAGRVRAMEELLSGDTESEGHTPNGPLPSPPPQWRGRVKNEAAPSLKEVAAPTLAALLWIFLPAAGSMLLAATTNKMCQDISSAPLLWIVPLALYLISFIVSFAHPRWYARPLLLPPLALAIVGGFWMLFNYLDLSILSQLAAYSAVLLAGCLVMHGEVARLKPEPARLGGFYLSIAFGGALGALAVAVGAPLLFKSYAEYPLALVLCGIFASLALAADSGSILRRAGALWAAALLVVSWLGCCIVVLMLILLGVKPKHPVRIVQASRNFYGVIATVEGENAVDGPYRRMVHGAIQHGFAFLDPARRNEPSSYYGPGSGIDLAFMLLPADRPRHLGVLGLGAGTLALFAQPTDRLSFYEINPQVVELAERDFTYLHDCRKRLWEPDRLKIELGDGRLVLERQPPQQFDLLALDAFSGDAVPVHLITREAFAMYLRHVNERGMIAVNVSNRHLDLRPVILQIAAQLNLKAAIISNDTRAARDAGSEAFADSTWILVTRDVRLLADPRVHQRQDARQSFAPVRLWTDDYSSVFSILRRDSR